ncbi:hypothetical protein BVG16_19565 [Paenibacillus selenitireducens]|uniref:Putative amidase domain-containing protein n=1 Tax=Paenibacillus selenitireducens TaxID=1324314 RepID=A0A1T2X6V2_9BACL|nr:amidase domain-containing protein [Paenibacillus selenitireducens]OPA75545.1 hypothetical protein BVG16_19565 [Paenibacillus selenitireducens]
MPKEWKNVLYAYVNQFNRTEIDYRLPSNNLVITDLDYLMRKSNRMHMLKEWYRQRDAVPLRSETRTKLVKAREGDGEVVVDLEYQIRRIYEKKHVAHVEERIEQERVTLGKDGNTWIITRVEQKVPEKHPEARRTEKEELEHDAGQPDHDRSPSIPLLNTDILGFARSMRATSYSRERAVQYADRWWNENNPEFLAFEVDCTNFISQCLFAGGAPIYYTGKRESGWWYRGMVNGQESWSYSWAVANALNSYLDHSTSHLQADVVARPTDLKLGDVISYDWDGDGRFQHSAMVTAFDPDGMPLVNAHTNNGRHRYWDYRDSYAWTEHTQYRFFHILDWF